MLKKSEKKKKLKKDEERKEISLRILHAKKQANHPQDDSSSTQSHLLVGHVISLRAISCVSHLTGQGTTLVSTIFKILLLKCHRCNQSTLHYLLFSQENIFSSIRNKILELHILSNMQVHNQSRKRYKQGDYLAGLHSTYSWLERTREGVIQWDAKKMGPALV